MTAFWTVIASVVIFAVVIFVHEFGHFIAAKLSGIRVHEFAIGMGPRLFGFGKGETKYSVRAFPIGGYCALEGEDSTSSDERAITNKPPLTRLFVLVSGAFMNILLGFIILNILVGMLPTVTTRQLNRIEPGSAAYEAGLEPGDTILSVNGKRTPTYKMVLWELSDMTGEPVQYEVLRSGEKKAFSITPKSKDGRYVFGISFKEIDNNFGLTIKEAFHDTLFYSRLIIETLGDLIRGKMGIDQVAGPIGIVTEINGAVTEVAQAGIKGLSQLLMLSALLTVNLGIFNLLPIPALDGGRILFVLIEIIRRKPLPPEREGLVHIIGFAALIILSVFVAYMDILKFF